MADLVTKAEACEHLRIDYDVDSNGEYLTSADDAWLTTWISVVSESVAGWLKDEWRLYQSLVDSAGDILTDSAGDPIPAEPLVIRPQVRGACLLELSSMYRYREGEGTDNVVTPDAGYGYVLNKTSTALLANLRKSTIA